ncbi:cystathionine gamma-synthase [Methanobrevibacter arboriphilus JCM 13429 = DSM 1125]|uniref:Cystathionine gamma-synthase n=1 Tax=Methanobrevibacter arboriphilus JCM 13429 = DSM 1125 TaxID=1300164 RepID=A0A1V6N3T6_METAZ|nr:aminotransferase class I/II-fold pyridoxal phosphate-dependent enzyme [Methanobrevibacter arboriphilus]OQD59156.1 cystathionine gamma-synthase [Methanobrevibacter arboriphilus JCM 13429 = DSM 1125]
MIMKNNKKQIKNEITDKINNKKLSFQTRAVHIGNDIDKDTNAIKRPITMANSYKLPHDPSVLNWSGVDDNIYTRNGGSNQKYLEKRIASLENAEDCIVLSSGVAALSGLFFSLLETGDHVIFSNVTYIAVYRLLNELFNKKFKVETTIVDTRDIANVKSAIKDNTKLIHIETPGNPTLSIVDISEIAKIAHENDILVSVDNTLASPYNQRPIELGADFSIESLTKYINGHGDSMGGSISGKAEYLDIIRRDSQVNLGGTISPFNAWLIMRGAVTLPLRMEQHNKNALKIAKFLESLSIVTFVAYPGLNSHNNHDIAVKQMGSGFGGVLSFGLDTSHDKHNEFVSNLNIITSAVSLGHDESLIVFIGEDDERQYLYPEEFNNGFFRFSVGLEDSNDLINDINQALIKTGIL